MMRCHMEKGHFIPGCMGAAAAGGCGKTLAEQRSYCTCPPRSKAPSKAEMSDRLARMEKMLTDLKAEIDTLRNEYKRSNPCS